MGMPIAVGAVTMLTRGVAPMGWCAASGAHSSASRYDPDGMDDAGDIAQKGKQDVKEKLSTQAHLHEHSHRW